MVVHLAVTGDVFDDGVVLSAVLFPPDVLDEMVRNCVSS